MTVSLEWMIQLLDTQAEIMSRVALFKRYFEEWFKRANERPTSAWMFSNVVGYSDKHAEWLQVVSADLKTIEALLDVIAPDRPKSATFVPVAPCIGK